MSSRFRASRLGLLGLGLLGLGLPACDSQERHSRAKPIGETVEGQSPDTIWPGGTTPPPLDARAKLYDDNAPAIAEGQSLYTQMNCVGCHFHGGGGMGPPLMDDEWRYGGRIDQIAASIALGRPGGMPAWKGKLTDDEIWKLAAYVRTLSGQPSKDVVGSRSESMSATTPGSLTAREPAHSSDTSEQ